MKPLVIALCLTVLFSGCMVVAPPVHPPAGVVYVAPTYPQPAPGYEWRYHEHHGWGWYHTEHGWHRDWR
jgi:hypothetical protein